MAQGNAAMRMQSVSRGPVCYIALTGVVDESFDPESLLGQAAGTKVILNLKGVQRLSSFGVREWTNAMKQLCQKVERVFLVECSPPVVSQLNMVANFAGTAQVVSVMAPFYCEQCGSDAEVKVEVSGRANVSVPETTCGKCGSAMSFEDDPEAYFSFPAQNAGEPLTDTSVLGMLRHLGMAISGPEEGAPRPIENEPTVVPNRGASIGSQRPESVTNSSRPQKFSGEPTMTGVRRMTDPSMSSVSVSRSQVTDAKPPQGFGVWINDLVNRHWQVFLGLAIVVLLVALILLLIRPQQPRAVSTSSERAPAISKTAGS